MEFHVFWKVVTLCAGSLGRFSLVVNQSALGICNDSALYKCTLNNNNNKKPEMIGI